MKKGVALGGLFKGESAVAGLGESTSRGAGFVQREVATNGVFDLCSVHQVARSPSTPALETYSAIELIILTESRFLGLIQQSRYGGRGGGVGAVQGRLEDRLVVQQRREGLSYEQVMV